MTPPTDPERSTSWNEALGDWHRYATTAGFKPTTVQNRERYLRRTVVPRIRNPWAATTTELDDAVRKAGLTRAGAIDARCTIRNFYGWATASGRIRHDPSRTMASPTSQPPAPSTQPEKAPTRRPGQRKAPRRHAPAPPPAWAEALHAWAEYNAAGGRSPRTTRTRTYTLRGLAERCPDPWSVTPEDLMTYMAVPDLSAEGRKARRGALGAFYRWATLTGRIAQDPTGGLPRVQVLPGMPRPCPEGVYHAALERADDRERLMLRLGWLAGLRRAEIAGLHTQDTEGENLRIRGKGGRIRLVPLHPGLRATLGHLPPGWVFPNARGGHISPGHVGVLVAALLGAPWGAHTLRHAAGTRWYAATGDILAVSRLLGHSKPETSAVYAALPDQVLRDAVLSIA